jgi:hypothetical protein
MAARRAGVRRGGALLAATVPSQPVHTLPAPVDTGPVLNDALHRIVSDYTTLAPPILVSAAAAAVEAADKAAAEAAKQRKLFICFALMMVVGLGNRITSIVMYEYIGNYPLFTNLLTTAGACRRGGCAGAKNALDNRCQLSPPTPRVLRTLAPPSPLAL